MLRCSVALKSVYQTSMRFFADAAPLANKRIICRPSNNLKAGIVGLPNCGKSLIYNCITLQDVPSENFAFCTIDPNHGFQKIDDPRMDALSNFYRPSSSVNAVLNITDIAGIVAGASDGKGLGNAFLSHIAAVDAILHLVRIFPNKDTGRQVEHVETTIDPIRDMEIISRELLLKDAALLESSMYRATKLAKSSSDPRKLAHLAALKKAQALVADGIDIREGDWNDVEVDALVEVGLLTAKPIVYLLNASVEQYLTQYDDKLADVRAWIAKRSPGSSSILFSADLEADLKLMEPEERESYIEDLVSETPKHPQAQPLVDFNGRESSFLQSAALEHAKKTLSMVPAITTSGYTALQLIQYFTAGKEEVRAWTIRQGSTAPQAAGVIHSDFEKNFNSADVFSLADLEEFGSEEAMKKAGRIKTQGKTYVVQDGDIMFFKHSAKK